MANLNGGAQSVFYSGQGGLAAAEAGKGSGMILADTIGGKILNYIDQQIVRLPGGFWKLPSGIFAANATESAAVFLRPPVDPVSVWITVEKPILQFMKVPIVYK